MHKKDRVPVKDKTFIRVRTLLCVQEAVDLTIFAPASFSASTRTGGDVWSNAGTKLSTTHLDQRTSIYEYDRPATS